MVVPLSTPMGTQLEIAAAAMDRAGNVKTAKATRVVAPAAAPPPSGTVAAAGFAGAHRLAVLGDRVFATTPRGLTIATLARGSAPSLDGAIEYATPVAPSGVAVSGDLAFLALGSLGLQVVDISAPAAPVLRATLAGNFTGVATWAGAVVASDGAVATRIDATDPSAPRAIRLSSSNGGGNLVGAKSALWTEQSGGRSYLRPAAYDGQGQLQILPWGADIGSRPALAAERDGDLIFAGTAAGLTVLAADSWPSGDRLRTFAAVSTPPVRALTAAQGMVYLACEDGVLRVIDARNPRQPAFVAQEVLDARSLVISGGLLLAATDSGIDLRPLPSPAGGPSRLATATLADVVGGLTPYRRGVLAAAGGLGLLSFDVGTPTAPVQTAAFAAANVRQVERVGREIFLVDGTTLKVALESADGIGLTPAPDAAILNGISGVQRIAVAPNRIWWVGGGSVSSAALPATSGPSSLLLSSNTVDVAGSGGRAVVAQGTSGMAVVRINAVGAIELLGTASRTADAVALQGDLAIAGDAAGLAFYDLSSGAPVSLASVATQGPVRRIRMAGRLALVSEGAAGVELRDVSNASMPWRVGRADARRADDAMVSAGQLIVADGLSGLLVDSLPAIAALPAIELGAPGEGAEIPAGSSFAATAAVSGMGVDSVELLVDGRPVATMDEIDPSTRWTVPSWATPGSTFAISARARSATGQAVSASREVRVAAASTAAPSLVSVATIGNAFASGATIAVTADVSGGLAPFRVSARFGATSLAALQYDPSQPFPIRGTMRLPVVAADATDDFILELVDGAGRMASWSTRITVKANADPPSAPTGLPNALRAGPYVNRLRLTASSAGAFTLRAMIDGAVKGSVESQGGSATLALDLQLPAGSVGQSVILRAEAEDAAGRISAASQSYTVQVDGVPPVVSFNSGFPPASAPEGSPVHVQVVASDPDSDLASVSLYADGALVRSSAAGFSQDYTLPLATSEKTSILFTARATDSRGRTAEASATVALTANPSPVLAFVPNRSLMAGETVQLCVQASDELQVATLDVTIDGLPVASGLASCGARCVQRCFSEAVPLQASVVVAAQATDVYGKPTAEVRTYSVVAAPPSVALLPAGSTLRAGSTSHLCARATDDVRVSSLIFDSWGSGVWAAGGAQWGWPRRERGGLGDGAGQRSTGRDGQSAGGAELGRAEAVGGGAGADRCEPIGCCLWPRRGNASGGGEARSRVAVRDRAGERKLRRRSGDAAICGSCGRTRCAGGHAASGEQSGFDDGDRSACDSERGVGADRGRIARRRGGEPASGQLVDARARFVWNGPGISGPGVEPGYGAGSFGDGSWLRSVRLQPECASGRQEREGQRRGGLGCHYGPCRRTFPGRRGADGGRKRARHRGEGWLRQCGAAVPNGDSRYDCARHRGDGSLGPGSARSTGGDPPPQQNLWADPVGG